MAINVVLAFMIIGSFLVAEILHELGHVLVAGWLGDPTPRLQGRLSFSLRSHIDPLGTLLCVILAFFPALSGPVGLGWGQPVKVDPWKLRGGPNVGTLLVALGGILINLVVGLLFALILHFLPASLFPIFTGGEPVNGLLGRIPQLLAVFAITNIAIAIFNLIPLHPLDGYQIVYALLPSKQARGFARSATYGPFIILAIIFLLPFLGQLTGLGSLFIFHIPYYILLGASNLVGIVSGLGNYILALYLLL